MSYCNINDAFKNMNHKFKESFSGLNDSDFDESHNYNSEKYGTTENFENSDSYENFSKIDNDDNTLSDIDSNFKGTSLNDLKSKMDNKSEKKSEKNLTHRDCINIYLTSDKVDKKIISHIKNCSLCKNELTKKKNELEKDSQKSVGTIIPYELQSKEKKPQGIDEYYQQKHYLQMLENENYRRELEQMNMRNQLMNNYRQMNVVNDSSISNALLEKILSKLIDYNDERKELNDKLNRLLNTLNNSNIHNNHNNFYEKKQSFTFDYITLGICIIIILLIVDIVLRARS